MIVVKTCFISRSGQSTLWIFSLRKEDHGEKRTYEYRRFDFSLATGSRGWSRSPPSAIQRSKWASSVFKSAILGLLYPCTGHPRRCGRKSFTTTPDQSYLPMHRILWPILRYSLFSVGFAIIYFVEFHHQTVRCRPARCLSRSIRFPRFNLSRLYCLSRRSSVFSFE